MTTMIAMTTMERISEVPTGDFVSIVFIVSIVALAVGRRSPERKTQNISAALEIACAML